MRTDEATRWVRDEDRCPACRYKAARAMLENKRRHEKRYGYTPSRDPGAMVMAYKLADNPVEEHTFGYNDTICHEPWPRNKCIDCYHLLGWGEVGEQVTCPQCGQMQVWVEKYFWSANPRKMYDLLPALAEIEE